MGAFSGLEYFLSYRFLWVVEVLLRAFSGAAGFSNTYEVVKGPRIDQHN